jgi:hypothetical protein
MVFAFTRCEKLPELVEELSRALGRSMRGEVFSPLWWHTSSWERCVSGIVTWSRALVAADSDYTPGTIQRVQPRTETPHGRMSDVWFARLVIKYSGHLEGGFGW